MELSPAFQQRILSTTDPSYLQEELEAIRRIVIAEHSPQLRDELCTKQRLIQARLFELDQQIHSFC